MKILQLTDDELKVIAALVNQQPWNVAKVIASLQDKCADAIQNEEPAVIKKGA